ncbi:hypothetical protein [Streptomyces sp. NPDC004629]
MNSSVCRSGVMPVAAPDGTSVWGEMPTHADALAEGDRAPL